MYDEAADNVACPECNRMRCLRLEFGLLWLGLTITGYGLPGPKGASVPPDARGADRPSELGSEPRAAPAPRDPIIPQAWDEGTIANLQLPLADPKHSPVEVSWDYYYRIPRRPIYKSYPVYAPGSEPAGYLEWLKQQEPQIVWGIDFHGVSHAPPLRTEADWIRAGQLVFDAPTTYDTEPWGSSLVGVADVENPAWYAAIQTPVGAGGVLPFLRYVIRVKGQVELGQQSCGMCHTRVMPDGSIVKGAQGNFPVDRAAAWRLTEIAEGTANETQLLLSLIHISEPTRP